MIYSKVTRNVVLFRVGDEGGNLILAVKPMEHEEPRKKTDKWIPLFDLKGTQTLLFVLYCKRQAEGRIESAIAKKKGFFLPVFVG